MGQGVGNLNVSVSASTSKARREVNAFRRDVAGIKGSVATAGIGLQSLALGLGAIAAGGSAVRFAVRSIGEIDQLDESAGKLGVATGKLAGLRVAADEAGIASTTLDRSLIRQNKSINDAARGIGDGALALDTLGLSARDLNQLAPDEQLRRIAEAAGNLTTHQEQLNVVTQLYGTRGADMLNVLKLNADGLDKAQQKAEKFGLAIDGLTAQHLAGTADAMGNVSKATQGLGNSLAVTLSTPLQQASDWTANLIAELREGVDWFNETAVRIPPSVQALHEKEEADKKAAEAAAKHAAAIKAQHEALKPFTDELAKLKRSADVARLGEDAVQFREDEKQFGAGRASQLQSQRDAAEIAKQEAAEQQKVLELKKQIADWGKSALQIEREKFAFSATGKNKTEGLAAFNELERLQKDKERMDAEKRALEKEKKKAKPREREAMSFAADRFAGHRSDSLDAYRQRVAGMQQFDKPKKVETEQLDVLKEIRDRNKNAPVFVAEGAL